MFTNNIIHLVLEGVSLLELFNVENTVIQIILRVFEIQNNTNTSCFKVPKYMYKHKYKINTKKVFKNTAKYKYSSI